MLESHGLLLRPWAAPPPARWFGHFRAEAGSQTRAVLDLASAAALGFAYRNPGTAGVWPRWLARPRIEVYETEDASLVFGACRAWWSGAWDVADAEGRAVGSFRANAYRLTAQAVHLWQLPPAPGNDPKYPGTLIRDRFGGLLAWLDPAGGDTGRILAADGAVLAELTRSAQGTEVRFIPARDGNPFLKMLLLAALLAGGW
jgi:hypothetical protein